jgi:tetratricopeptide (TPR) repeat protein
MPPDEKSPLDQFLASTWAKISAFVGAVVALTGFAALWEENFIVVGFITFGLATIILAVASFGWRTRIIQPIVITKYPKPAEKRKEPFLPLGWLKAARIAFDIVILGWLTWGVYLGYSHLQEQRQIAELEDKVVVLIAEIDGPDPKNYRVTEELISQLSTSLADYDDTVILPLGEIITEQQGSPHARQLGTKRHADVVLWGYYGATATDVHLTLHVENLQPEKMMTMKAGETMHTQAAIAQLDSFTVQQDISSQMTALVFYLSGFARYQAEDYPAALARFDQALAQSSWADDILNRSDALFYRGTTHLYLENWQSALADFTQAIVINPNAFNAYNNRGFTYYSLNDYPAAIADFTKAIELNSGFTPAYNNRGLVYSAQGQYAEAFADYNHAIRIAPNDAIAYYNRGNIYSAQGQYAEAIADYTQAIALDPQDAAAYYNRGNIYSIHGQYAKALADYNEAIRIDPNDATAYTDRGLTYSAQGQYAKAIADYNQAIALDPHDATTYYNRGGAYADLQDYPAAIADYTQALALDPQDTAAYNNRGNTYADLKDYPAAIADYTQAIALDPNLASAYYNRGNTYADLNDYPAALADFQHALTLTSDPDWRSQIEQAIQSLPTPTP